MQTDSPASVTHNEAQSRFELGEGAQTAVADYVASPGVLAITHVGVPPALRGRGVASQLAQGVMEYVRAHGLKVRPICPFMVTYLERHPQYQDLIAD